MTKPAVTLYNVKGSPLTTSELDTNFTNLRDSTINFTGDAGDTRSMDLNDSTAITGSKNIQVTVSESGQSIVVKNTLSDYSLDPMGFENHTDSVISFTSGSRTFTISPVGGTFRYWYQGTQYNKTSTETVTLPATTALYLIYYNGASLSYTTSETDWATMTPVAHLYWNNTASTFIITDERHGIHMSRGSKEYIHQTQGAAYSSGLIASNYTTTGTGNTNSDAQLDLSSGVIYDQEHRVEITHSNSPTANTYQQDLQGPGRFPVLYKLNGAWTLDAARDYPVKNGTSLVTYNLNTAGTWSTPDATSTHYVAYWLVATNALNTPVISVMGQRSDNKLSDAETNNTWSSLDFTDFPIDELRPLYRLIFRTASTYTNGAKAYLAKIDDYRYSTVIPTAGIAANNSYSSIQIFGGSTISADSPSDTLILSFDENFVVSVNDASDTITILGNNLVRTNTGSNQNLYNKTLINSSFNGGLNQGNKSGSYTIDYNDGVTQEVTLTGNLTLEGISNFTQGSFLMWVVKQDATGGRTLSMGSGFIDVVWKNNDYSISTGANKIDVIKFFYSNGKVYAELLKDFGSSAGAFSVSANALTGTTLASNVVSSSLTSVGTLTGLTTSGTITNTQAAGTAFLDRAGTQQSYANGATVDFSNFSGMIIVNRQDGGSGNVALWLCGSGATVKLGDSIGDQSGTIASNSGINGYRWTNNTGGTITASFAAIRTRNGA